MSSLKLLAVPLITLPTYCQGTIDCNTPDAACKITCASQDVCKDTISCGTCTSLVIDCDDTKSCHRTEVDCGTADICTINCNATGMGTENCHNLKPIHCESSICTVNCADQCTGTQEPPDILPTTQSYDCIGSSCQSSSLALEFTQSPTYTPSTSPSNNPSAAPTLNSSISPTYYPTASTPTTTTISIVNLTSSPTIESTYHSTYQSVYPVTNRSTFASTYQQTKTTDIAHAEDTNGDALITYLIYGGIGMGVLLLFICLLCIIYRYKKIKGNAYKPRRLPMTAIRMKQVASNSFTMPPTSSTTRVVDQQQGVPQYNTVHNEPSGEDIDQYLSNAQREYLNKSNKATDPDADDYLSDAQREHLKQKKSITPMGPSSDNYV